MKILISPAKKMRVEEDLLPWRELPAFLPKTERLMRFVQGLSYGEAKGLWACNDSIAELNFGRFRRMDLYAGLTPALFSYEGIQYQYLAPRVLEEEALEYLQEHLRILSGFYGILKPFDGVTPYRLEMQAKAGVDGCRDLYEFWGKDLADFLMGEDREILNLASREYAVAVERGLDAGSREVTCIFGERVGEKIVQKGTKAKMARGEMVRFLAEQGAKEMETAKEFQRLEYRYQEELSSENEWVFLR
ncbi:peroxide stress protein YaaA [Hominifimenecus sp. rT4P-3]|uniref:peroxide stress protein YaaA n=1 Tax=Hominifimenecus sp. rT4P-3 TaxID=3242979 RepID=UPI003DA59439